MTRFSGKSRAAGGAKGFSSHSPSPFGAFSSSAGGSRLSYLFEPPNLSSISDPNVAVSLKNVLKKDSTTKARALEELVLHAQQQPPASAPDGVEDAVLDAWVQIYPRAAVDNSRRVRELAHSLLLDLVKSAKKRMERRIPKIVGPWLAGTYDKDRVVARAATDALQSLFNTDEKILQFWRRCQPQILEYAIEAVQETPDSLSDERSTTKDDSEAKYHRVLSGGLSLVMALLQRLDVSEIQKNQEDYDRFFSLDAVWNAATSQDSFVRRQYYQLLSLALETQEAALDAHIPKVGKLLVSEAVKSDQTGSATDLVKVLASLTKLHPEIWGTKKPSLSRLRVLLEKGSQGSAAPSMFWQFLDQLIAVMPQENLTPETAADTLKSIKTGISNRSEPATAALDAWSTYLSVFRRLSPKLASGELRSDLATKYIQPLIEDYVHTEGVASRSTTQLTVAVRATLMLSSLSDPTITQVAKEIWNTISDQLVENLQSSLSEAPEDFEKAQKTLADECTRFYSVVGGIHERTSSNTAKEAAEVAVDITSPAAAKLLLGAMQVLIRGTYKLFGAASVLDAALSKCPFLLKREEVMPDLERLFPTDSQATLETMLSSDSAPFLLSFLASLFNLDGWDDYCKSALSAIIGSLLSHPDQAVSTRYLAKLLSRKAFAPLARQQSSLQDYLKRNCLECARGANHSWELFEACFTFDILAPEVASETAEGLWAIFEGQPVTEAEVPLKALEIVAQRKPTLLSDSSDLHLGLVAKLLSMAEISDQKLSSQSERVRLLLEPHADGGPPLVRIIQQNLEEASPASLGVDTLVDQASKMAQMPGVSLEDLFPSTTAWIDQLILFLDGSLNPSLSLTSDMGGVYLLGSANRREHHYHPRDRKGLSVPARMAVYTTKLLTSDLKITALPKEFQVELLCLLSLVEYVVADQIVLLEENRLWASLSQPEELAEAEELVSSTRRIINDTIAAADPGQSGVPAKEGVVGELVKVLIGQSQTLSPLAVYSARALAQILRMLTERHGFRASQQELWVTSIATMSATPATILPCAAILSGYGELLASSAAVGMMLNRLVSDIAYAKSPDSLQTLLNLILFNACMPIYAADGPPVANNRLVFAVRQITSWFDNPDVLGSKMATECCRALGHLFPCVKDVYGSHWEKALGFCRHLWDKAARETEDRRLPYVHASLKLVSLVEGFDEPNDDLADAIISFTGDKTEGLLRLLMLEDGATSQPAERVNALLCRQTERIPLEHIKDLGGIYGLMDATSRDIQRAAFGLLHRKIPSEQARLSEEILLEKTKPHLPAELLSLLLDPPTLETFHDELLAGFPTPVRGYLLTWVVIFDAFGAAAFRLRSEYYENLKATGSLGPLLDLTFDVLGHSVARPLNLEKAHITADRIMSYDMKFAEAETEELNMHWLFVHVYYLALRYVPGLVKSWYIECRSKQTRIAVEAWTRRYFSPLIVAHTIDEVVKWNDEQEPPEDDEKELIIKTNKSAREVTVGYQVDEEEAAIAIKMPESYPLDPVSVISVNRVAVTEKKWQSWLMTTQGVITFSHGSVIDGITTFRRNVVAMMKDQSECAICYCLVSSDKRLPDKRCGTCKNLFHRSCLLKWFQSSAQNTCPLCRNQIDYGVPRRQTGDYIWGPRG
ncbi:hypothetical protein RB598_004284 [Gaeumannomyces tritici]